MSVKKCCRFLRPRNRRVLLLKFVLLCLALLLLLQTWSGFPLLGQRSSDSTELERTARHGASGTNVLGKALFSPGKNDEACEMCDEPFAVQPGFAENSRTAITNDSVPVFRHFYRHDPWLDIEPSPSEPGQVPPTVHYLWCNKKYFEFHHYLGVVSLIRLLRPVKIVFHYAHLPELDYLLYNTWFIELKQSVPGLILKPLPASQSSPCVSKHFLHTAYSLLRQNGGVYVTSNVILSHVPADLQRQTVWSAFAGHPRALDLNHGVVIASQGLEALPETDFIRQVTGANTTTCAAPENYELRRGGPKRDENIRCVYISDGEPVQPKDIMHANSSFAELARWLFYGKRAPLFPSLTPNSIPRISHMIWITSDNSTKTYELQFDQYLSILSALHVGGFHRVYVHGNVGLGGPWWERLRQENVTFVYLEQPEKIFQQDVVKPETQSNVLRNSILYKYGGAYHDFDATWTQRVPDWLLAYPAVGGRDWVVYGEWPDTLNNGVLLAKPQAPWLQYLQAYYRYYTEGGHWTRSLYGAIMTTYRTYERHPDQLFFYDRLQVMCHHYLCHPSWEKGFRREMGDRRNTLPFDWRTDTLVVHVTQPAAPSFASPEALKKGTDMMAEIGRFILKKSGRGDILH